MLVADDQRSCSRWGDFDGFVTSLGKSDVNGDGYEDVLIIAAMQTAVAVSNGSSFSVVQGSASGMPGSVSMSSFTLHKASGDICTPSEPEKGIQIGRCPRTVLVPYPAMYIYVEHLVLHCGHGWKCDTEWI